MRTFYFVTLLMSCTSLFGQEVSFHFRSPEATPSGVAAFYSSEYRDSLMYVFTVEGAFDPDPFFDDREVSGLSVFCADSIIFQHHYNNIGQASFRPFGDYNSVIIDSAIYWANALTTEEGDRGRRFLKLDLEGNILAVKDTITRDEGLVKHLFKSSDDRLYLVATRRSPSNEYRWQTIFSELDYDFNTLREKVVELPRQVTEYGTLIEAENGELLFIFSVLRLDDEKKYQGEFRLTKELDFLGYERKLPIDRFGGQTLIVPLEGIAVPTQDGGYLTAWAVDSAEAHNPIFQDSAGLFPTVYKFDSEGNKIKETIMPTKNSRHFAHGALTLEDYFLLIGSEFDGNRLAFDPIPHEPYDYNGYNAHLVLMNQEAERLWERNIIDLRYADIGLFQGHQLRDSSYFFHGTCRLYDSLGNAGQQNAYVLTLDKNGCWNGNCNKNILITSDSTSYSLDLHGDSLTVSTTHPVLEQDDLYLAPNPSNGMVTLRYDGPASTKRRIRIYDAQGRHLQDIVPSAPETQLYLTNYGPGVFLVQHWVDDVLRSTERVVVR